MRTENTEAKEYQLNLNGPSINIMLTYPCNVHPLTPHFYMVFQRSKSFDHLTAVSGVGSSPALATCETRHVLLAGVSGGFPGVLSFRPTYRFARLL